jgi:hypothetical protein
LPTQNHSSAPTSSRERRPEGTSASSPRSQLLASRASCYLYLANVGKASSTGKAGSTAADDAGCPFSPIARVRANRQPPLRIEYVSGRLGAATMTRAYTLLVPERQRLTDCERLARREHGVHQSAVGPGPRGSTHGPPSASASNGHSQAGPLGCVSWPRATRCGPLSSSGVPFRRDNDTRISRVGRYPLRLVAHCGRECA